MINGFPPSAPQSGTASGSSPGPITTGSPASGAPPAGALGTGVTTNVGGLGTNSSDVSFDQSGLTPPQNPALAAWAAFAEALQAAQAAVPAADLAPSAPSTSPSTLATVSASPHPTSGVITTGLDTRVAPSVAPLASTNPSEATALPASRANTISPQGPDVPPGASTPTGTLNEASRTFSSHTNTGSHASTVTVSGGDVTRIPTPSTLGTSAVATNTADAPTQSAPAPALLPAPQSNVHTPSGLHTASPHGTPSTSPEVTSSPLQNHTTASTISAPLSKEPSPDSPRAATPSGPEAMRVAPTESPAQASSALGIDVVHRAETPSNTGLFGTSSTSPTPQSTLPTHQGLQADVARQIAHALRQQARDDSTLTLQLRPDHLGKVEIAVTFRDGQISMQLSADTGQTRDLLRQSLQNLKQSLNDGGLDAGDLDVSQHAPREFLHDSTQDRGTQEKITTGNLGNVDALEDTGLRAPLLASASTEPLSDGSLDVHV